MCLSVHLRVHRPYTYFCHRFLLVDVLVQTRACRYFRASMCLCIHGCIRTRTADLSRPTLPSSALNSHLSLLPDPLSPLIAVACADDVGRHVYRPLALAEQQSQRLPPSGVATITHIPTHKRTHRGIWSSKDGCARNHLLSVSTGQCTRIDTRCYARKLGGCARGRVQGGVR